MAINGMQVKFKEGEILFKEGEPGGDLFVISSGELEVYRERKGRRYTLTKVGPGEILGAMTATNERTRTASVVALTAVEATHIKKQVLTKVLDELPRWAHVLIDDLIKRVSAADENIIAITDDYLGALDNDLDIFHSAMKLARSFVSLGDLFEKNIENKKVIDIEECFKRISAVFKGNTEQYRLVLDTMVESRLLPLMPTMVSGRFMLREDLPNMTVFIRLLGEYMTKEYREENPMPLTAGEREYFSALTTISEDATANVKITTIDVASALREQSCTGLFRDYLKRGAAFNLFRITDDDPPLVEFIPQQLKVKIACYDVMAKIGKQIKKRTPKTLIY